MLATPPTRPPTATGSLTTHLTGEVTAVLAADKWARKAGFGPLRSPEEIKMTYLARRKFDELDADKSGRLSSHELGALADWIWNECVTSCFVPSICSQTGRTVPCGSVDRGHGQPAPFCLFVVDRPSAPCVAGAGGVGARARSRRTPNSCRSYARDPWRSGTSPRIARTGSCRWSATCWL